MMSKSMSKRLLIGLKANADPECQCCFGEGVIDDGIDLSPCPDCQPASLLARLAQPAKTGEARDFQCQECGKLMTVNMALEAEWHGCTKCGSVDIDLAPAATFSVPPVCTANWDKADWRKWVGNAST